MQEPPSGLDHRAFQQVRKLLSELPDITGQSRGKSAISEEQAESETFKGGREGLLSCSTTPHEDRLCFQK